MRLERLCVKLHYGTLLNRRLDPSSTPRRLVLMHNHANREEKRDVTISLDRDGYLHRRTMEESMAYCFVPECNHVQGSRTCHFHFLFSIFFRIYGIMFCWDPKIILLQQQHDVSLFKKKRTTKPLQFNDLYTNLANSISDVTNPYTNNLWVWTMYFLTFFRHSPQCLFGHCRW